MAKIYPIDTIKGMSGKICSHSNTYFSMNSVTGVTYTGTLCAKNEHEATELQKAHRNAFAKKAKLVSNWLNANKGNEAYKAAQALRKQLRVASVRSIVYHYMNDEGIVNLPDADGTTVGGSTQQPITPPTGGGGESDF